MNCPECRTRLEPYLDGELGVSDNLEILAHVNACDPCRRMVEAGERRVSRLRGAFASEFAPASLRSRISSVIAGADRGPRLRRSSWALVPAAAAAAFLLVFFMHRTAEPGSPAPENPRTPSRPRHTIADHGAGVAFAVDHFLGLDDEAQETARPILDPEILRTHSDHYVELEGEALAGFYRELFGEGAKLPASLVRPQPLAAALSVEFRGTPVSNLVLDLQDRRIGIYSLKREDAALADMKLIDDGVTTGLRIERCKGCHVIAVTRGERVFILVSKEGVDPLITLIQQTF